ncbi:MAG: sigma-54 dependent transcriptional regulator [Myxococcota bacterium]|nr:sigma-54 dependent transcriptional regulator [Myxococcota bacterium]MDW8362134.1 sigma-54 dependent transcriptional regulator [Myxococcales bacterium]
MTRPAILVVDDEKNILATLARALRTEGFDADVAGNAAVALDKLRARAFDLVLLDVQLPDVDGLTLLGRMREQGFEMPAIVMSGHGGYETAVEATRRGAYTFVPKPIEPEPLFVQIRRALEYTSLRSEHQRLLVRSGAVGELVGESAPMRELRERIARAAPASAPVLVTGERGTGKELVARAIHAASRRASGPLEKLNCAAVPAELVESELFGHEAGAFTGASRQRRGKFERAHGGTLFLDEIGDMPLPMQAKLLRVLQDGEIERVGGSGPIRVDVRVIAATNKPLSREIAEGRFRADLYDRIHVVPIHVPALRERREDIPALVAHFLRLAAEANDRPAVRLTEGAMQPLLRHDWPGNVRELRNFIERLVILAPHDTIDETVVRAHLPAGGMGGGGYFRPDATLREMLEEVERDLIRRALEWHQGHVTHAASALGLERSHLYKKMRALGLRRVRDDRDEAQDADVAPDPEAP